MKKRLGYIDISKAFAIIFIVIGHFGIVSGISPDGIPLDITPDLPDWLVDMAYTFHVPLFFIVSGYFLNPTKQWSLKRESKALLLPYAISCVIILIGVAIYVIGFQNSANLQDNLIHWLLASSYGMGDAPPGAFLLWQASPIGGLWFLLALFWGRLFFNLLGKLKFAWLWIGLLFLVGYFSAEYIFLPFSFQSGMCTAFYLYLGYIARKYDVFERKLPIVAWVAMLVVWVLVIVDWNLPLFDFRGGFAPVRNYYPNGILDIIGALCATMCIVGVSKQIERFAEPIARFLQMVGRNTLPFFAMHIVDLDVLPQNAVYDIHNGLFNAGLPLLPTTFVLHFAIPTVLCLLLYILPKPISKIYFPQKAISATAPSAKDVPPAASS